MNNPFAAFQHMMPAAGTANPFGMAMPGSMASGMGDVFKQANGQAVQFDPEQLSVVQATYMKEAGELWMQGLNAKPVGDRRFAAEAWQKNPMAAFSAAGYLLNARTLMALAEAVQGDAKTRARVAFAVQQWIDASAPSNFLALNAEAQQKAIDTQGESIAKGVANLLHDIRQGHLSMTDESVFEVGKNVATSEGAVVFENDYFQLIEYKPLTAKVYERPFLLVPPSINKFYILDLQPENSLIRYAVEQGHRTFVVSWRNPDESLAKAHWDDYIEGAVIEAIRVTREITGAPTINALGFCVGGTMPRVCTRCAGGARRRADSQRHLFDHLGGLHRHRRARRVHRRVLCEDARDAIRARWFDARARLGHHLQLFAPQRFGVELCGGQLPQGRVATTV